MPFLPMPCSSTRATTDVQGCDLPDLEGAATHEVDTAAEDGDRRRPLDRQDELGIAQPRVRGRTPRGLQPAGAVQAFSSW